MKTPLLALCLLSPASVAQEYVLEIGPSAVVTVPYDPIMNTTERFTVEWWMSASPSATGVVWPFWRYGDSAEHKATQVTPDGRVRYLYAGSPWLQGFETGTTLSTDADAFPRDGTWHHIAFVRHEDDTYEVYVDGALSHSGGPGPCWLTCSVINSIPPTELLRGDAAASGWRFRDLRVSSVDRYSGPFFPVADHEPDLDTALLMPFDEGAGQLAFDHGPAGQVGLITGEYEWVPDAIASTAYRLGTGLNPVCYESTSLPILGALWTAEIDASSATSGWALTSILAASAPVGPLATPFGEVLIGVPPLGGTLIFKSLVSTFGPKAYHVTGVPSSPTLAGLPLFTQGLVVDGTSATLCNGIDLVLGYAE